MRTSIVQLLDVGKLIDQDKELSVEIPMEGE